MSDILAQPSTAGLAHSVSGLCNSAQGLTAHDPQVYLAAAAQGRLPVNSFEIVDFVSSGVEEEIIMLGDNTQLVISVPSRPKLESIYIHVWSIANLATMCKLVGEGKIDGTGIFDYVSYSTKLYQLFQRLEKSSVLQYDREYRRMQATYSYIWGTDYPHMQTVQLLPRTTKVQGK
jgi:hypothetical protein